MTHPSSMACPHCGSASVVRDGWAEVDVAFLDGTVAATRKGRVLRVACREPGCGRNGTIRDAADVSAERKLRDHVVGRLFALGQTGAQEETGVPRSTVQRLAGAWAQVRERDAAAAAPAFLLLGLARLRRRDAVLVADADRRTLVEVLDGTGSLPSWLSSPGRLPALRACIPLDARLRDILRTELPGVAVMVAPAVAARAVRAIALRSLGAVRRAGHWRGSNGFPRQAEFAKACAGPVDTGGWPVEATGLLAGARAALGLLEKPDRPSGEAAWPEVEAACGGATAKGLLSLLRTWRDAILEGLGHRHLDAACALLDATRRGLGARRPALGFVDLRRYALLRTFEVRTEGGGTRPVARGVCLKALCADLAAA